MALIGGRGGKVILVMIWDKIKQFLSFRLLQSILARIVGLPGGGVSSCVVSVKKYIFPILGSSIKKNH